MHAQVPPPSGCSGKKKRDNFRVKDARIASLAAMADGDRVSAALWVDGGRCADARARDASRALFPRSIFHGFSLRACAGELCRVRRAVAPQPCAPRSAYSFGITAYFFFQDNTWSEFRSIRLVHVFLKQKKQISAGPGGPDL